MKRIALSLLLLFVLIPFVNAAEILLPPANWYAVIWSHGTDTLHWINANGEQASIPRPKLPGEAAAYALNISPNGRYLVVMATLQTNNYGIGFYDLQTDVFMATHEAQPGEIILPSGEDAASPIGFAAALRVPATGAWRLVDFDITTGAASSVVNHTDEIVPANLAAPTFIPEVILYDFDQAETFPRVHVRFNPPANDLNSNSFPSFTWIPNNPTPTSNVILPNTLPENARAGLDVVPQSGQIAYSWADPQFAAPASQEIGTGIGTAFVTNLESQTPLFTDVNIEPRKPRWLNGLQWLGFQIDQEPYQTHWTIMPADGPVNARIPLGPNIGDLHGTPDGYLAVDYNVGIIYHMTTFAVEAFSTSFGTPVFEMQQKADFEVVYVTPLGSQFTLASVTEPEAGIEVVVADEVVQATQPVECPGAPAPRLTIGGQGRVAFTNGAPLRMRATPNGDILTQIAEGTTFTVLAGPQCNGGYLWWQIEAQGGQTGWSAEGNTTVYFMEPTVGGIVAEVIPTATPVIAVNPPLQIAPTATPQVVNPQLGLAPTATTTPARAIIAAPICASSPATRLQVGSTARTIQPSGTLAVYLNADSPTPYNQFNAGITIEIIGGPQCNPNNLRLWQARATVNGEQIIGWVAEGFQQLYYLEPVS